MANFVSYNDAETIITEIGNKFDALTGAYVPRGSSTFANLPSTLTAAMSGYVYNMSEDFTTDARFVEGAGKKYKEGQNVVIVNVGDATTPDMKFDVVSGFVDVDGINARITANTNSMADVFDQTQAYVIGDVVVYNDTLYQFTSAHTAGTPWNVSEVTAVTLESLIGDAEPDSLTMAQINALIALLN